MSYKVNGVNQSLLLQNLFAFNSPTDDSEKKHIFSILLVLESKKIELNFGESVYVVLIVSTVSLIVFSCLIFFVIFKTSHALIRPLRKLNTKMKEVMMDDDQGEPSELKADDDSSLEITLLYQSFQDLI